ncbi:MAG: condensation domain-containing protein, partial [Acidobacteriota bacterium]|nr:condensation domain-containing protein [Acidobacteriota bacterium]
MDLPIGRPIAGQQVYVLNALGQPMPVGAPGELFIGGTGIARGYLGRPSLTASRFVPDAMSHRSGARLYRTGDRARWRQDGSLEFLGRLDEQVKIRGYRVEPGEVESALLTHPSVRECVVIPKPVGGDSSPTAMRLVAFIVLEEEAREQGAELDVGTVRHALAQRLPEYMLPSTFDTIDAIPLTPNGKVDRRKLAEREVGLASRGAYEPPRNDMERLLAKVWQEVLSVEQVSINDDFFELGGDSIVSLKIISRLHREGLRVTPRQIFEHSTVAELAAVAGSAVEIDAEQGAVTGEVPLLPIQRWFLESGLESLHHTTLPVLLQLKNRWKVGPLQRSLTELLTYHDAMRISFQQVEDGWRQINHGPELQLPFQVVDLSRLSEDHRGQAQESVAARLQASFRVDRPPLVRFALFDHGMTERQRLFLVAHHLIMDNVAWEVVVRDLAEIYTTVEMGGKPDLPPKTTSFKRWAERLAEYGASEAMAAEAPYWADPARRDVAPLPVDFEGGINDDRSESEVQRALSAEVTQALLQEAPKAYRTRLVEVLLGSLTEAFGAWTGERLLLVDFEGHGREDLFDDVDLSRTAGWFASLYPVLVDLRGVDGEASVLKMAKEQVRAIPGNGLGYGLLRDYGPEPVREQLAHHRPAEVLFTHLGQMDAGGDDAEGGGDEGMPFELSTEPVGSSSGEDALRTHLLDIETVVQGGQLVASFRFSRNRHKASTLEALADAFVQSLERLAEHCRSPEAGGWTPSDFPLAKIEGPVLDRLASEIPDLEDLYPLSPLQQGMMFHTLHDPEDGPYIAQFQNVFPGDLDVDSFARAWARVAQRNPVLRTSYHWDDLEQPLQAVHAESEVPVDVRDWRELSAQEQAEALGEYLFEDRRRGFEFSSAPLLRFLLVRETDDRYRTVGTLHQSLFDGWSLPEVMEEFSTIYQSMTQALDPDLPDRRPYRDYIEWLTRQDQQAAQEYWQTTLAGFAEPTPLVYDRPADDSLPSIHGEQTHVLTAALTAELDTVARNHRLTLNTLVQGAWALLLARYSRTRDVVFGVTVSGRPPALEGVEQMIGLFINTLPLRVQLAPDAEVGSWLQKLQEQQAELGQYEYSSLADVQRWSDVGGGRALFD